MGDDYGPRFRDRIEAGRVLAEHLSSYAGRPGVMILALPRGGVPVASEVAKALDAPLDVFIVRKLGVPGREELAFGALASGGIRVLNVDLVSALRIPEQMIERVAERERIAERLRRASTALAGLEPQTERIGGKRDGVELALSYVEEADRVARQEQGS